MRISCCWRHNRKRSRYTSNTIRPGKNERIHISLTSQAVVGFRFVASPLNFQSFWKRIRIQKNSTNNCIFEESEMQQSLSWIPLLKADEEYKPLVPSFKKVFKLKKLRLKHFGTLYYLRGRRRTLARVRVVLTAPIMSEFVGRDQIGLPRNDPAKSDH